MHKTDILIIANYVDSYWFFSLQKTIIMMAWVAIQRRGLSAWCYLATSTAYSQSCWKAIATHWFMCDKGWIHDIQIINLYDGAQHRYDAQHRQMRRSTAQTDATEHSTDRCDGAQHRQMRLSTAQTDATEHSTDRCDGARHRQIQRSTEQTDATEHSTDRCDGAKSIAIAMYKVVVQLGGLSLEIEELVQILGWRN